MENSITAENVGVLEQFQTEFVRCWRNVPNKGLFLVLLAVWLTLFQFLGNSTFGYVESPSLLRWMFHSYTGHNLDGSISDDSIGLWTPLVVLGLFWWKRDEWVAASLRGTWWPGLLVLLAGIFCHLIGYIIQQPRVSIVGLLVGVYGLMGLAWGPECLRRSFFPFFLLIFCVPLSTPLEPITTRLRLLSTVIVQHFCDWVLGIGVLREGTILKDPNNSYHYEVAAACSGIRSLISIGFIATVMGFLTFRTWWRRGVMIAAALPLAVVGNVVRLLSIIVAAEIGGQAAGDYIHEGGPGGIISLLPYVLPMLGLVGLSRWLRERKSQGKGKPS